ncbi:hypothetical protein AGOR_G00070260 [Albula goreensis]|uniref:Uncharacterized protein n=1 Tax=Albula goreensis TaxID=1534307 RepID=A0A8T3DQK8_9TELE|nr:hypothetical protein AGOR_G00070260 [Albula goreensis]
MSHNQIETVVSVATLTLCHSGHGYFLSANLKGSHAKKLNFLFLELPDKNLKHGDSTHSFTLCSAEKSTLNLQPHGYGPPDQAMSIRKF